ncbi:hypothetical protein BKA62DRAFT_4299 [Auriculariales sp. MPI-PUGE-AT-0066]|nr:hypothetical protein BKA62DRAFT_4299 [Auriculariales sp. MPI-PUGE-AT-0066]
MAAVYLIPTSRTGSSLSHTPSVYTAPPPYHGGQRSPPYDFHAMPRHAPSPMMEPFCYSPSLPPSVNPPWFASHPLVEPVIIHRSRQQPFPPPSPATSPEPERQMQSFAGLLRRAKRNDQATSLHPLLGMKPPPLLFDVRFPDTRLQVSRQWADAPELEPATGSRATFLRIVFEDCPWTINVCGVRGRPVTPADIFKALYQGLAQPMTNTEWSLADDTRRRAIHKANLKRRSAKVVGDVRRVDWLGKRTLFSCMRKCTSSSEIERRWLSTDDYQGEVWVVQFESNQQ